MSVGGGKYEKECTVLRESTGAAGVLAIIMAGVNGTGFSVQVIDPALLKLIPAMLRRTADEVEKDLNDGE